MAAADQGGAWGLRRALRAVLHDRASALDLLLGHEESLPVMVRAESLWTVVVGGSALVALLLPRAAVPGMHSGAMLAIIAPGVAAAAVVSRLAHRVSFELEIALAMASVALLMLVVASAGPQVGMSVVPVGCSVALSFLFFRRRIALAVTLEVAIGYALVLGTQSGYAAPALRWLVFVSSTTATGLVVAWAVGLVEDLARQERAAAAELDAAHASLAELNAQLAEVVDEQGAEIGSLQQLRQFVSPQIADAVVHDGFASLTPHRSRIAVVFCDLRGFTSFSSSADPEEVMDALDRYYETVGGALYECNATVGTFAGDGIMAYFGDPVACEDPAGTAVEMAVRVRSSMQGLVDHWRRRGFGLGCGMGIAYGYATIGPVGFAERRDYTPLGPTVNLASRLCDLAADGEILVDPRAYEAVLERVTAEERVVDIRGFRLPVTARNITSWRTDEASDPAGDPAGDQTSGQG